MYGEGISLEGCLVDLGVEYGIINKSGAWYSYGDERLGQGKENVKEILKNNAKMAKELDEKIRAIAVSKPASEEGSAENVTENNETIN